MLSRFLEFIRKEKLVVSSKGSNRRSPRFLLAVSGGLDSVALCDLCHKARFSFGIAHCNFTLRGKESAGDEQFVERLAKKYQVPFHCRSFATAQYARQKKLSVQMAARELRYRWLHQVAARENYAFIVTAHHLDDSIETFFINLIRGTGIAGLQGIPVKQGIIIRPLLFASKELIRTYASENRLSWREDRSNASDKYLRNRIRHHLIPSLKKLNGGFEKTISKELSYFKEAGIIFKKFVEEKKKEIVQENGKTILLNIKKLKHSGHAETLLHELLRAYDFTPETTELIARRMYTTAGKKFLSPTYQLIKDRDFFILAPRKTNLLLRPANRVKTEAQLKKGQTEFSNGDLHLVTATLAGSLSEIRERSVQVAYLDHSRLSFPLTLRKWKPGDFFFPLGMKGKKKLSDFFIDAKVPLPDKENTWILVSGKDIAWVVGYRIDERFKVHPQTKKIYKVTLIT